MTILQPLYDRVILKRVDAVHQTPSGLVIPERAQEKSATARVVAVGPGRYFDGKLIPMSLVEGDLVMIAKYCGTEVKVDSEDMLIVREEEILSKVVSG